MSLALLQLHTWVKYYCKLSFYKYVNKIYFFHTEPECLQEWLRVVKPGGYIVFTNKTQFSPIWESVQDKLEDDKSWQSVWKSNDMFYMPCCPKEDLSTRVKVLIYRKTTQRMKNPSMSKFGFNFMIGHGQTVPEIETLDETHGR